MSVPTIHARTELPVPIFREVIAVIVKLDILETIVKQISTSAHLILVKMAAHVRILLEVITVIVNQDILATTVKQISTSAHLILVKMAAHVRI